MGRQIKPSLVYYIDEAHVYITAIICYFIITNKSKYMYVRPAYTDNPMLSTKSSVRTIVVYNNILCGL